MKMPGNKNSEPDLYRREQQRQKPESMLRQLWRAVEESAELVIITDRPGVPQRRTDHDCIQPRHRAYPPIAGVRTQADANPPVCRFEFDDPPTSANCCLD
jgi:hypothetical protein